MKRPRARNSFCILVALVLTTAVAIARDYPPRGWQFWSSEKEGLGATFPNTPERIDLATGRSSAYAYLSTVSLDGGGGSTFSITVEELPKDLPAARYAKHLEAKNLDFIKGMAASEVTPSKWVPFGQSGRKLTYHLRSKQGEFNITSQGFWLSDRKRSIKVGISYTDGISARTKSEFLTFPESFFLVTAGKSK